jgi:hypothetical protein
MENTHITPEQIDVVRLNHAQRLLDVAEALLQNFEAMPLPKDAAGTDRAVKALLTLHKTLDALHSHARSLTHKAAVEAARPDAPEPAQAVQALRMYQVAQDVRLQTLALKRSPKADEQATGTSPSRHHWP